MNTGLDFLRSSAGFARTDDISDGPNTAHTPPTRRTVQITARTGAPRLSAMGTTPAPSTHRPELADTTGNRLRLLDLVFAALAAALAVFHLIVALSDTPAPSTLVEVLLAVLFVPAFAVWRSRVVPAAIALTILTVAWTVNWLTALPANLGISPFLVAVPMVVYSTARYRSDLLVPGVFTAIQSIWCFFSPLLWWWTPDHFERATGVQAASWIALQWLVLGLVFVSARSARTAERHLVAEQEAARERERAGVAREIHDVLAHSLTLINMQAGAGVMLGGGATDRRAEILSTIQKVSSEALEEVRGIVGTLRDDSPPTSVTGMAGIRDMVGEFRSAGLTVEASLPEGEVSDSQVVRLTLRRVVQEALTNVLRHQGPGSTVTLTVEVTDEVHVVVDSRVGGPIPRRTRHSGAGLTGVRERVEHLGGTLDVDVSDPAHAQMVASFPVVAP
ncbi:sensor histidine kinase [Corynebacterium sp. CCM 9204]|uniref:sensor histidine kinase n=1 Tax=Corynebacterium sp. CCM 9204 TaxID=3057616 RepID=UPI0035241223